MNFRQEKNVIIQTEKLKNSCKNHSIINHVNQHFNILNIIRMIDYHNHDYCYHCNHSIVKIKKINHLNISNLNLGKK